MPPRAIALFLALIAAAGLSGCVRSTPDLVLRRAPEPTRQAPQRTDALERVADPRAWANLDATFQGRDEALSIALSRTATWFTDVSKRSPYPFQPLGITHEQARAGVLAFREHLRMSANPAEFRVRIAKDFDLYVSVGSDGRGTVLFTGYYSPVFRASRSRSDDYRYPLYAKPPDLVMEKGGERVLGRNVGGRIVPYPTRAEIERNPSAVGLAGREIAWFSSKLDAYLVQVQGSARLELVDGGPPLHVGYAGSNGREYTGLGKLLVADGKVEKGRVGVPAMRAYFREHPDELDSYLNRNERFVFFAETPPTRWPVGALGVQVSPMRTVATDKTIFPRGGVVLIQTTISTGDGGKRPFEQFMLDQDAGGGILAPGRVDIYTGIGDAAGEIAGRQTYQGRLYYFVLKPERAYLWAKVDK